jgi:hypothetical protein
MARNPLDRSLAFTALLDLDPEGFGKSSDPEGAQTITTFLGDFYDSGARNMYTYAQSWLSERREATQRVTAGEAEQFREAAERYQLNAEVPSGRTAEGDPVYQEAEPEAPDKPWQVTAQVQRTVTDARGGQWQSSRQVPAFTIPRALAYAKGDAEAKAREIINPYGEPYDIHMDVTTDYVTPERQPEAGRQVLDGDEQQLEAVQEGQAEAGAEARGPRGPSASYAERVAEGQQAPGPGGRQLQDRAERKYHAGGLEPERGE